jgi:hypothetical protein
LAAPVDKAKPTPVEDGSPVPGDLQNAAWNFAAIPIRHDFKNDNHFQKMLDRRRGGWYAVNAMEPCIHKHPPSSATRRFVLAALSVEAFIKRQSGHDHNGAGDACSICMQVAIARHVFNSLACIALALIVFFAAFMKQAAGTQFFCFSPPLTLVSLKVQSNTRKSPLITIKNLPPL